jgi:hypothetical protein
MKYAVINVKNVDELNMEVNDAITIGFEPLGGICANTDKYGTEWFCQAMIKRDKEPGPTNRESQSVEPTPLVLEVGKLYRTREGKKAFVFRKKGKVFRYCIVGESYIEKCTQDGRYYEYDLFGEDTPNDLIEEWRD